MTEPDVVTLIQQMEDHVTELVASAAALMGAVSLLFKRVREFLAQIFKGKSTGRKN